MSYTSNLAAVAILTNAQTLATMTVQLQPPIILGGLWWLPQADWKAALEELACSHSPSLVKSSRAFIVRDDNDWPLVTIYMR